MNGLKNAASIYIPVLGGLGGFFTVYLSQYTIPPYLAPYFSLGALAGLDAICGGVRAGLEGKFHDDIFLTGFLINALLAAGLAYMGDRIGVDLYLAAVLVLGWRIFTNLSLIRRYFLTQLQLARSEARKEA